MDGDAKVRDGRGEGRGRDRAESMEGGGDVGMGRGCGWKGEPGKRKKGTNWYIHRESVPILNPFPSSSSQLHITSDTTPPILHPLGVFAD